jgi:hypothetical protein
MLENLDPESVKSGFDALRAAIETLKGLRDFIKPGSPDAEKIDLKILAAEREIRMAEAQLALSLGYKLCRAHFPPVPMLKVRVDAKRVVEVYQCPVCNLEEPSPEYFAAQDRDDESVRRHNERMDRQFNQF